MQALADLIPGFWQRSEAGSGYRFDMTEAAAVKRDRWWRLYLAERKRALVAQRRYVLQRIREGLPDALGYGPDGLPSDRARERVMEGPQWFQALPPSLQERIAARMVDSAFSRGGGTAFLANAYLREGVTSVPLASLPDALREPLQRSAPELCGPGATVRFSNSGYQVMVSVAASDGRWQGMPFGLSVGFAPEAGMLSVDHAGLPEALRRMGPGALASWKELAEYQKSTVWPNTRPDSYRSSGLPPRRADILDWLADRGGLQFVADYYSTPSRPMSRTERMTALSRPLTEELGFRAVEQDMSWKQFADGLYLFRNNRWYRDDRLEVPTELLKRWEAERNAICSRLLVDTSTREGNNERSWERRLLDLKAEIVARLTPFQITNGLSNHVSPQTGRKFDPENPGSDWRPFQMLAETVLCDYYVLRFYSALTAPQRTSLLKSQLPLSLLSPPLQRLAGFILPELEEQESAAQNPRVRLGLVSGRPWLFVLREKNYSTTTEPLTELRLVIVPQTNNSDP
jgi:hypothetical protein